ncbi:DinB family protein [Chroococcus sp. FPU101]|uniref:DinB family protein n=1 Tax=Chroococcus sp. FPU101 TaxID=1974212 RepID=UPI001A903CC6|nr:DinB family protein [Chroococcus sp. FPU101]GFE67785.1 hypothetical protein CFPU101_03950 [Chroococcus sp. FPU101]
MQGLDYIKTLCSYNCWMNEKIYSICQNIPDAVRKEDKGAFFKSIHGTLNHILLADRIWLGRFKNNLFKVNSLEQELYSDFVTLWQERQKTDQDIENWINNLTEHQLAQPFRYHSIVRKKDHTYLLGHLVLHFFNHQTHHRGQVTTLIKQVGYEPGVTDLLWLPGAEIKE